MRLVCSDEDESSARRWIVVADADQDAANLLAGYLLYQRFRAYPTGRGSEALRVARVHPLSLAVIDVQLADMAGRELFQRLRAIDPALPVIMTTADFGAATEMDARRLGIIQYVQKPFDFRRLELVARRIHTMRSRLAAGVTEG
ncbi:MAG: response regulator transcription factor [Candidatus Rokubacteria bacterium]|nr:response regulator transcription factor [Candidatus Rokubacteria bacterium]